ncbi:MAG: ABC transporter ATP-binding protein [Desulfobacterales bacterium]
MIEANHISKRFGVIEAVKDVSFTIDKGEVVGFLGPNGAGKTTTMRILACFFPPTSGSVKINGLDVTRHSLQVRQLIGYSLEKAALYPDMRVLPFLRFVGEVKGLSGPELKKAVSEVVNRCGLEFMERRIIKNLSRGYQQRLTLAQALIHHPDVLILDEPTAGLDPENISEIRQLIKSFAGERTIILSSHVLSEVSMICGKVMIMDNGRIVAVDTPKNLGLLLQEGQIVDVRIEGPAHRVAEGLEKIDGVRRVQQLETDTGAQHLCAFRLESEAERDILPALNGLACQNNWVLREMVPVSMTLEEIFFTILHNKRTRPQ